MNTRDPELLFIAHYPPGPVRTFAARLLNEVGCAVQTEAYVAGIAECSGCEPGDRERVINRALDCGFIRATILEWHRRGKRAYVPCLAPMQ
jgi:hypothetical protein